MIDLIINQFSIKKLSLKYLKEYYGGHLGHNKIVTFITKQSTFYCNFSLNSGFVVVLIDILYYSHILSKRDYSGNLI